MEEQTNIQGGGGGAEAQTRPEGVGCGGHAPSRGSLGCTWLALVAGISGWEGTQAG
jgi:hypothetical protein